ncbi:MAG: SusD/RagB family nutrient-binding outer membrane lipoprotein [Nonlabens sp.]|uniref:SusD/RagB family nutrient-binding outer membrane lipoprotein n=1 Tax=Nonlabens sp. TaxID=1888209 RepID=UPI0035A6B4E3
MKNISKILLIIFSFGALTSCEQDLDVNTNPNTPDTITPDLALASAEASLIAMTGGELANVGGFYAQYYTQAPSAGQYDAIDEYNLPTNFGNRVWDELYSGCLNDLQYVITESELQGNTGKVLIGRLLQAYTYQVLVDVFGDVPYTEALAGVANINPKVTPGNEIYTDLINQINTAVANYNANPVPSAFGAQDVIYQGDMTNWLKFANTLKLKMYMRMSYTSQADPAAVTALLAQNNFITANAGFAIFGTQTSQRNPFFETNLSASPGLGDINHVASNTLMLFYTQNNDPRRNAVYRASTTGAYASIDQGNGAAFNNTAIAYSRPNITAQTPVYLITVAESNFLQAEALIRYSTQAGAKAKYDLGVASSFSTYGLPTASATALTATGAAYEFITGLATEQAVRQVMVQKWAALANVNNIEAYIETTRTKFPEVVPFGTQEYSKGNRVTSLTSILSATSLPSILFYPQNEVDRNKNITQRTSITQKVWWDQKN